MNNTLTCGEVIHGFKLVEIKELSEYKSQGLFFIHEQSGAELFHIYNNDRENTFSFCFNTPAEDNTGAAHIVEHSVLSGSRLYNVKDPFQAMMKGSMNTFLNAYTFPDKTCYPASTILEKDYFNLMKVYADSVFFPLLKKEVFLQEGHRLEPDDEGNLSVSGIVYNEMKGNFSSVNSIAGEWSIRSLFSEGPYSLNSGGDPEFIPDLTYEEFKAFHQRNYHPSNCRIFLYGDIPSERSLEFLHENFLKHFETGERIDPWNDRERWNTPRSFTKYYPSDSEEDTTLLLNWKLFPVADPEKIISMEILHHILTGTNGSPLTKAIHDSPLGEDMSPVSGLETELSSYVYTVGIRGSKPENQDAFKELLFSVLSDLVEKGIDPELVEGAIRGIEFRNREIHGGSPFGLRLMRKSIRGWMNGGKPWLTLEFDAPMKAVREKAREKGYFEGLIKELFLDNSHYSEVTIMPDTEMQKRLDEELKEKLRIKKQGMSEEEFLALKEDVRLLKEFQDTPDREEDINSIPRLNKDDIPLKVPVLSVKQEEFQGVPLCSHETFTNGVVYFDFIFNLDYLDRFYLRYMLIFARMLTSSGFSDMPYSEVAKKIALTFGGISASMDSNTTLKDEKPDFYIENLFFRGKVLENYLEEGMDMVIRFLKDVNFHDYDRLKQVVVEMRNDFRSSVVPSGASFAALRAARVYSLAACRDEGWYGVSQYVFLEELASSMNNSYFVEETACILDSMRKELLTKQGLLLNITCDSSAVDHVKTSLERVLKALPEGAGEKYSAEHYEFPKGAEALQVTSSVSFSALSLRSPFLGSREYPSVQVLAHLLKTGYLWEHVRMKGGAYGAYASASGMDGSFTFATYRDPRIKESLEIFKESLQWIATGEVSQEEIDLAIITLVGHELRPFSPAEEGSIGLRRHLSGITDELRQKKRQYLMAVTPEDLKKTAEMLLSHWENASIVVMASKEDHDKASGDFPGLKKNIVKIS